MMMLVRAPLRTGDPNMSQAQGQRPKLKILVVSSVGGHLTEVMQLSPIFEAYEVVLVVNDVAELPTFPFSAVYQIAHAERDLRVIVNLAEAARILVHERPDVVVSAGAGPAVPFAAVARWLFGCRVVYLESAAAIRKPTLTGRLMYRIAHDFFYQWPALKRYFPNGHLAPVVFG
jgi:beta-1,4-N-acetylglucosaminyltransferase